MEGREWEKGERVGKGREREGERGRGREGKGEELGDRRTGK